VRAQGVQDGSRATLERFPGPLSASSSRDKVCCQLRSGHTSTHDFQFGSPTHQSTRHTKGTSMFEPWQRQGLTLKFVAAQTLANVQRADNLAPLFGESSEFSSALTWFSTY